MVTSARLLIVQATMLAVSTVAVAADYSVKVDKTAPPKQLAEPVAKEMSGTSIQLVQDNEVVCAVWLCDKVPSIGTATQAKNGLTYQEIKQGTLLGSIEIVKT